MRKRELSVTSRCMAKNKMFRDERKDRSRGKLGTSDERQLLLGERGGEPVTKRSYIDRIDNVEGNRPVTCYFSVERQKVIG